MSGMNELPDVDHIVGKEWHIHSIYDVLDTIREMPELFIGAPNLTLLYGFLLGFESSCHAFKSPLNRPDPDFAEFGRFVGRNLGRSAPERNWRDLLLEEHSEEKTAFTAFFKLLDTFREPGTSNQ